MNQQLLQLSKQQKTNLNKSNEEINIANVVVVVMSNWELSGAVGHDVIVSSAGGEHQVLVALAFTQLNF